MDEEWESLRLNGTFDEEFTGALPHGHKAIPSRWVFRLKRNKDGTIRFKARLVIKGFLQVFGIDYGETYAPVARLTTLRVLLAIAARRRHKLYHLDVVTAFLNPMVDKEIYMALPKGMANIQCPANNIVRLRKALYGLRQSPRLWYKLIDEFLTKCAGLTASSADPNLYVGKRVMILL